MKECEEMKNRYAVINSKDKVVFIMGAGASAREKIPQNLGLLRRIVFTNKSSRIVPC